MKNSRLKLLILVLVMFSFTFFMSLGTTKAIYRETKSTSINLSVVEAPLTYTVTFNSNGGTSIPTRNVEPSNQVGVLPIPTKANSNFAGWYDENNQRVRHTTVITRDTVLHAEWTNVVCRRVTQETELHTETCLSGGCRVNNDAGFSVNDPITYGYVGDGVPVAGDAYDCDVDYDGTFDNKESDNKTYTERFYFVREQANSGAENNAVMLYSTSFDANGRTDRTHSKTDIGSYNYSTASGYLPTSSLWDNPLLVDLDGNGKVSRFITIEDLESVCGTLVTTSTSYFATCQNWMWFENTRFQSSNLGRAGIWMEYDSVNDVYHRIHTESFNVAEVQASSSNMARPVMEIPMSALEGYYDETRFDINFITYIGDTNPPASQKRYRGEALGTLPTPVQPQYIFVNWYTDSNFQNVAEPTDLVSGNMNLYALWTPVPTYTVTLYLDGGTITGVNTQITLNSGDLLDNLPDPTKANNTFGGWYIDSGLNTPFDDTQPITSDLDLYAKWVPLQTVTVTLYLDGGTITGVTSPITLNSGDLLDNLPDPTKTGYDFKGWYTDSGFNTQFDETQPITTNLDLYAKWVEYVAEVNGVKYETLAAAISAVPTGTTNSTTVTILKNITLQSTVSIPNNKYVELDVGSYTITASSCNLFDNSGRLNIINGTFTYTGNGKDSYVIFNKASGAILNISGGTLSSTKTGSTIKNTILNAGTINITGGTITNASLGAAINNNKGRDATINMSGGQVIGYDSSGKSQAIYNAGVLNISGDAYLESSSNGTNARATVHNVTDGSYTGTLTITGGRIVSNNYMAVKSDAGTTTIGINDTNGNIIDTTTPILEAKSYAVEQTGGTLEIYDGVFKTSASNATRAYDGTITIPSGTAWDNTTNETVGNTTYLVSYLKSTASGPFTVTFDPNNDGINTTVETVASMGTVGANMPTATKTNYIFEKWYISVNEDGTFTSSTPIVNDITVLAKWKPAIGTATINPGNISLYVTQTETITVTGPAGMEDYSFSSSDTTVATVDANGVVTAVGAGTATIYITGSESNASQTVPVTVGGSIPVVYHTVTFYDGIGGNVVKTTQVEDGTQIGAAGMPSTNPTKTNYVFENWYVNGVTSNPAFNSSATITADTDVIANWNETVAYATLVTNPSPMVIIINNTGTITLNPTVSGDTVESYACSSSDTTIATVNNCTVTGVGVGSTTITITGSDPNNTKTVSVTVDSGIIYHTVTFYDGIGGNVVKTTQVEDGTQIGAAGMPSTNPTKQNYVFENWYVNGVTSNPAFNSSATITADTNVIANWNETVAYATLVTNPSPMVIIINNTGTITLNPTVSGDTVESYACSSSDTSVATVSNCTVTGVDVGSTTITITGSDPNNTKTVNVTVNPNIHTVTFDKNNGDQPATITINDVVDGTLLSTLVPNDPTKTDYTFDNWYLVDNGTWTNNVIDTTITVTSDLEYRAGFYSGDDVAAIGHHYYPTLANTFNAIGTGDIPSAVNIRILKDFTVPTTSGQNRPAVTANHEATIDGNGHTITCGNNNIIWVNGGTVTINNLTLTCNASKTAPIDNAGTINVIDSTLTMTLTGTNGRATIYNTGTVNIYGNSNLSTVAKDRPTVQNVSSGARINIYGGTITQAATDATEAAVKVVSGSYGTITGGTITSTHLYGVYNEGTLVIGTKDDQYDTTSIVITGEQYGINSTANYSLYDGLIKGKSNNKAVNDESKINKIEDGAVQQTGIDGDFYTLYYTLPTPSPTATPTPTPTATPSPTPTPNQLTINFDAIGVTNPSSQQVYEGSEIGTLPTVTWGNKTFDGWYTDTTYTTQVTTSTIPTTDGVTYYAKWTYTGSKVTYDSTNDAMDEYFDNISTWKNQNESTFATTMLTNFNNNGCSNCNAANNCDNPTNGTYCDKPKEYNTNANAALSVFLYDETNHVIGEKVEYASLTNGKITNLIPGQVYYWEKASDPTVNGLIEATTPRRTIDAGNVRNVRDLGGLSVTYTENNVQKTGTIKYGKLFRGAKLTSNSADVTSLTNLGITREIDLRPDGERGGAVRLSTFDNGNGDIIIHNYLINHISYTYSYLDKNNVQQTTVAAHTSYASELKSALKATMEYIISGDNIYFHCTIGTDRTGTLAYFLEGLLGVSEEDRVEDYELTYFFGLTNRTRYHDYLSGSDINPRFTFMHVTYPSNQDIYDWFTYGDSSSELTADELLIKNFRNAMIDFN